MNFIVYKRVSTAEQGNSRNGLEAQTMAVESFAEQGGHTILETFQEVASGKLDLDRRPVLTKAIAAAQKVGATLLVAKLDRLSRSVEFIATMMNSRVRFATVEDGLNVDPFMLHLKASFAENERKQISSRTKAALGAVKARGVVVGAPAHKDPNAIVVARAAATVAVTRNADDFARYMAPMLRMMAGKLSYAKMAQHLNNMKIKPAASGRAWHGSTVFNVMKRMETLGV